MLSLTQEQTEQLTKIGLNIIDITAIDIELYMSGELCEFLDFLSNNIEQDVHVHEEIVNIVFK